MSDTTSLPRVEDFRSDLTPSEVAEAEARNLRALAMQGYLLAFPAFLHLRQMTEYVQGRRMMAPGETPLAGWFLMRQLSDPTVTTVSPNVDTLYGAAYALLDRQGPIVIEVPPIRDRYYSVMIADAYFDVVEVISPRTWGNDGGEWLLVAPGWDGEVPEGVRAVIESPTPAVFIVQRVYVRDRAEIEALHAIQDAIRLVPLALRGEADAAFPEVDVSDLAIPDLRSTRDPIDFFRQVDWYTGWNRPTGAEAGMAALFAAGGVGPGATVPEDPAAQAAIRAGAADAQALMNARITAGPVRNGWKVPPPTAGLAGPWIADRAAIQATAMGLFPNEEAMYFFAYRDGAGALLDGRDAWRLTFAPGALPPVGAHGFWSLTMYDERSLLVANPLDRYSIRPDTPGMTFEADGSLVLHLAAVRPEGVPEGDWLPAPAGAFNVALRTYLPQPAIVTGDWFPPAIERAQGRDGR